MGVQEEVTGLLPTTAARWVAMATPPTALAAFAAPHFLSPLLPKSTEAEIVLAQLLLLSLVGLIGSLVVLGLVLHNYKLKETNAVLIKKKIPLHVVSDIVPRQEKIRDLLISTAFQFPEITSRKIGSAIKKPAEFVNYHFLELEKLGLITPLYFDGGPGWVLTQSGREYAIKYELPELSDESFH